MRELLRLEDPAGFRAPQHVREVAAGRNEGGTRILRVVWDEEEGYPEHAWGNEQWSVRPYRVGQGCDGTTGANMHVVALHLLPQVGIDYRTIYHEAYPESTLDGWPSPDESQWLLEETELPPLSERSLELLLHDLCDTNHRTLEDVLRNRLGTLGWLSVPRAPRRRPVLPASPDVAGPNINGNP